MTEADWLADGFEQNRTRLRAVAYRMLGSLAEADDAVQEAWLRLSRSDASGVDNLGAWLTTVVARICLNVLRSRNARREERSVCTCRSGHQRGGRDGPEEEALLADSVGLALQVVLDTLTPAERLAFVLHDLFDLPFDEIARLVGRPAARRGSSPAGPGAGSGEPGFKPRTPISAASAKWSMPSSPQRAAATWPRWSRARPGCRAAVGRGAGASGTFRGAPRRGRCGRSRAPGRPGLRRQRPALVNGAAGAVATIAGQPVAVIGFTISRGKLVEIDVLADPERLGRLTWPCSTLTRAKGEKPESPLICGDRVRHNDVCC